MEQIFNKLRIIDKNETELRQHIRQLDMLSVLRDLQKTVHKLEKNMPIILDIKKDLVYQKGEVGGVKKEKEDTVKRLILNGFDNKTIQIITLLSQNKIEEIRIKMQ